MILDAGYWMLDTGCWMLDAGYWMLDAGYWMLDAGYWMLDTRYWMFDVWCLIHSAHSFQLLFADMSFLDGLHEQIQFFAKHVRAVMELFV